MFGRGLVVIIVTIDGSKNREDGSGYLHDLFVFLMGYWS